MMVLAGVLAAGLASAPGFDALIAEIDRIVLAGRPMPQALLLDVRRLPDAGERMQAVIYLRRSGLLTGSAVSLDDVVFLRPPVLAAPSPATPEASDED